MNNTNPLEKNAVSTSKELTRATIGAVVVAAVLALTVVLPAELGVDPTGIGHRLGLTAMGQAKATHAAAVATPAVVEQASTARRDALTLTLQPGEGAEIKATMRKGDVMNYAWSVDKNDAYYDFHGEAKGAAPDQFTSFETGTKGAAQGSFTAPFEGIHGWYWKNRGKERITVLLKTDGVYQKIARMP
jgi:hypothetical protein